MAINPGKWILVLIVATVALVIASQIITGTITDPTITFESFEPMAVFKWLVVGLAIFAGYAILQMARKEKFTRETLAKDIFMLALAGVAAYFLWDKILGEYVFEAVVYKAQAFIAPQSLIVP